MKKWFISGLMAVSFVFCSYVLAQETLTLVTYYPSPYGIYRTVKTVNDGEEVVIGNDTTQPSIQLLDTDADGGNPYITFSNDGSVPDISLVLVDDDRLRVEGGYLEADDVWLANPNFGFPRWASDLSSACPCAGGGICWETTPCGNMPESYYNPKPCGSICTPDGWKKLCPCGSYY